MGGREGVLGVVAGLDPLVGLFVIERVGVFGGFLYTTAVNFVLSGVERDILLLLLAVLLMKEGTFLEGDGGLFVAILL